VVTVADAPASFLGVQVQVSINSVQGRSFPYAYAVIVARPEFGGWNRPGVLEAPSRIVVERKKEGDVLIAVVRQQTTKQSGYHTDLRAARRLLDFTLCELRKMLAPA